MSTMYSLKPIVPANMVQQLPSVMYRLPQIQGNFEVGTSGESSELSQLEARQENILNRLNDIKRQLDGMKTSGSSTNATKPNRRMDIVVRADPTFPPKSVPLICKQLEASGLKVFTSCHVHSTLTKKLPQFLQDYLPSGCGNRSLADVCVTLIWKEVGRDPECIESALSSCVIKGEANLLRFFCRTFNLMGYENTPSDAIKADFQLDNIHSDLFWGDEKDFLKSLEATVKKDTFLGGRNGPNVADLLAYSALESKKVTPGVQDWAKKCKAVFA